MPSLERVRFVRRDRALVARINRQPPDLLPWQMDPPLDICPGPSCWIAQTFIHLRKRGFPVRLAAMPSPRDLNVVHYDDLPSWKQLPFWAFLAVVQADRPRPALADVRLVQNRLCIEDAARDRFVVLWPQPGLRPRDPARGARVSTLGYFGLETYLAQPYRDARMRAALGALGVALEPRFQPEEWTDYRGVDAVLAVREVSELVLAVKPATKMINAWRAGCIPIMGVESACRQVGRPGVDYLEVTSPDEVVAAVRRLREDPGAAERLRAEGRRAVAAYDDDALARQWIEVLDELALPAFERWRREGMLRHLRAFPARMLAHRRTAASFWTQVAP
jgi:Glycosyl transferases group 1